MEPVRFDTTLKSARLLHVLRNRLLSGEYQPGDRLPSEPDLIATYGVSRATLREVVASLEHEGLLQRVQGKGTYVAAKRSAHRTIAVVMPYLFFSDSQHLSAGTEVIPRLVQSIETEARQMHANILLYLDNRSARLERENIEDLLQCKVDGVILNYIGSEENQDCLRSILSAGLPLVMIDRYIDGFDCDYVVTDNAQGAREATEALLAAGFTRILYLTPDLYNSSLRDRQQGYEYAMQRAGQTPQVLYTVDPDTGLMNCEKVEQQMRAIEPPFAIFTAEAPYLTRAYQIMRERDLQPHQFALACFDEPILLPPGVFHVRVEQPLRDIGLHALRILREKMTGTHQTMQHLRLKPSLYQQDRD